MHTPIAPTRSTLARSTFALALALALARPSHAAEPAASEAAAAEPSGDPLVDIRLSIEEGLPPDTATQLATLPAELRERLAPEHRGEAPHVGESKRRALVLYIGPGPFQGDYFVRVEALVDGRLVGESVPQPCLACSAEQVAESILEGTLELTQQFPPVEAAAPTPAEPSDDPAPPPSDAPARARAREPLLPTGIALTVLGTAGLATGVALIVVHERFEPDVGQAYLKGIDYRPAGIASAVAGGVVLGAGVALLVLGVRKRKQQRVAAAPLMGPQVAGVVLAGHF